MPDDGAAADAISHQHRPPRDRMVARLQAWGAIIVGITGLATAILKPQDQSVTKAAYQQCSDGIEKLNAAVAQDHESLAALRGYIAAKEGQSLLEPPPGPVQAPAGMPAPAHGAPTLVPAHRPAGGGARPAPPALGGVGAGGALGMGAGGGLASLASAPAAPAAPEEDVPLVAPLPKPAHPMDFDSVVKNAK